MYLNMSVKWRLFRLGLNVFEAIYAVVYLSTLGQVMACCLFSANPTKPMSCQYCQWSHWEQIPVKWEPKYKTFYHKNHRKMSFAKWRPICSGRNLLESVKHKHTAWVQWRGNTWRYKLKELRLYDCYTILAWWQVYYQRGVRHFASQHHPFVKDLDWDCLVPHCIVGSRDRWEFPQFCKGHWHSPWHSPNGRQVSDVMVVQGDCERVWIGLVQVNGYYWKTSPFSSRWRRQRSS